MAKTARRIKSDRFTVMTAYEATMAQKPRYNAYACGHGAHGKRGYDRAAEKRKFQGELDRSPYRA